MRETNPNKDDPMGLVAEALVAALFLGDIDQASGKLTRASAALDAAEKMQEADSRSRPEAEADRCFNDSMTIAHEVGYLEDGDGEG